MAKNNLIKNRAVIKAMSIGLSAMMAMSPITSVSVFADDDVKEDDEKKVEAVKQAEEEITEAKHDAEVDEYKEIEKEEPVSDTDTKQNEDNSVTETTTTESSNLDSEKLSDDDHKFVDTTADNAVLEAAKDGEKYKDETHNADVTIDDSELDDYSKETAKEILDETDYEAGEKQGIVSVERKTEDGETYVQTETKKVTVDDVKPEDITWEEPVVNEVKDAEGNVIGTTTTVVGTAEVEVSSSERTEKEYDKVVTTEVTTATPKVESNLSADDVANKLAELGVTLGKNGYTSTIDGVAVTVDADGNIVITKTETITAKAGTVVDPVTGEKTTTIINEDGSVEVTKEISRTDNITYTIDKATGTIVTNATSTTTTKPVITTTTVKVVTDNQAEINAKKEVAQENEKMKSTMDGKIAEISDENKGNEVKQYLQAEADDLFAALKEDEKVTSVTVDKKSSTVSDEETVDGKTYNKDESDISSSTITTEIEYSDTKITEGKYEGFYQLSETEGKAKYDEATKFLHAYNAKIQGQKQLGSWVTVTVDDVDYQICVSEQKKDGNSLHEITYSIRLADEIKVPLHKIQDEGEQKTETSVVQDPITKVVTKTTTVTQDGAIYSTTMVSDIVKTITVVENSNGKEKVVSSGTVNKNIEFEGKIIDTNVEAKDKVALTVNDGVVSTTDTTVPQEVINTINDTIAGNSEATKGLNVTLTKGSVEGKEEETSKSTVAGSEKTTGPSETLEKTIGVSTDISSSEYYKKLQEYQDIAGLKITETRDDGRKYEVETTVTPIVDKDGNVTGHTVVQTKTLINADEFVITGADTEYGEKTTLPGQTNVGVSSDSNRYVIETTTEFSRIDKHTESSTINDIREEITITLSKETKAQDLLANTFNGYDFSQSTVKSVTKDGASEIVDTDDKKTADSARKFMNELQVASDVVVYANTLNATGGKNHSEGLIFVGKLENDTDFDIQTSQNALKDVINSGKGLAYVGEASDGYTVKISAEFGGGKTYAVSRKNLYIEEKNGGININAENTVKAVEAQLADGQKFYDEEGYITAAALEILLKDYPTLVKYKNGVDIDGKLGDISKLASGLISSTSSTEHIPLMDQIQSIQKATELLNKKDTADELLGQDVITINLSSTFLTGNYSDMAAEGIDEQIKNKGVLNYISECKLIERLLAANENKGATIVFNVVLTDDEKQKDLVVGHALQAGVSAYQLNAGNIVWNFGDYGKNIEFQYNIGGVIVAPEASVLFVNNLQSGRVIANSVKMNCEVHQDITQNKTKTSFKIEQNSNIFKQFESKEWSEQITSKKIDTTVFDAEYSYTKDITEKGKGYFIKGDISGLESVIESWKNTKSVTTEEYSLAIDKEKVTIDKKYEMTSTSVTEKEESTTKKESVLKTFVAKVKLALNDSSYKELPPETPPTPPETPPTPPETPPTPPETPPTPDVPTPPETPPEPELPTPPTPETPVTPETPDVPVVTPGTPVTPETPGTPGTPATTETPATPETPVFVPGIPTEEAPAPQGVLGVRKPTAGVLGARKKAGVLGEKRVLGARTDDTANRAAAAGAIAGSSLLAAAWMLMRRKKN